MLVVGFGDGLDSNVLDAKLAVDVIFFNVSRIYDRGCVVHASYDAVFVMHSFCGTRFPRTNDEFCEPRIHKGKFQKNC